jgi:FXSXX-COOH protein
MPTIYADEVIVSEVSDIRDLPLDTEDAIDDAEYAHIMRRSGVAEGDPGTSVSAFNSSI